MQEKILLDPFEWTKINFELEKEKRYNSELQDIIMEIYGEHIPKPVLNQELQTAREMEISMYEERKRIKIREILKAYRDKKQGDLTTHRS